MILSLGEGYLVGTPARNRCKISMCTGGIHWRCQEIRYILKQRSKTVDKFSDIFFIINDAFSVLQSSGAVMSEIFIEKY